MILKFIIIFFSFLSLTNCKDGKQKENKEQNCYEIKDNFIYLNFYNNSKKDEYILKLTSIMDKEFYLLKDYFEIKNDTLYINITNRSHISLSHKSSNTKIEVKNDTIKLEKGKRLQQLFKLKEDFNYIILESDNFFEKCN
jgi:hypothetical protein